MAADTEGSASISLYFDVPHNEAVSLQSIARAATAWDSLIKELASVADPSARVEVDFLSGTVGSRSLNSIIRATRVVAAENPWTAGALGALAGVFLLAIPNHIADDGVDYLAKEWLGHEDDALTENDVDRVAKRVVELQRNRDAMHYRSEIYLAGEIDGRVKGIGATPKIQTPPTALYVPRARFLEYTSVELPSHAPIETRYVTQEAQEVMVVRPYSKAEERRWRFEDQRGEFSATMRDPVFLEALRYRKTGLDVGEGVTMIIDLRVKEELVDDKWVTTEYDVIKVRKPNIDIQGSLQFSPDQPDEP